MPEAIDAPRVSAWLSDHIDGAEAPFTFDLIGGGRSNLTFTVIGADGTKYVLRRPPLGHVLESAHDMAREHRIIAAVGQTTVPVPAALGLCTDPAVNGAPFYVMGHVDGVVLDRPDKADLLSDELKVQASEHLIDVLAELHAVDIDAVSAISPAARATSSASCVAGPSNGPTPRPVSCRRSTRWPCAWPTSCPCSRGP